MANIKITDLSAYSDPESTDVLPIVDITNDATKKVSIADLMENAGAGAEATPGIAFDGDPDTGIYRPAANQLAFSTGGTQRILIDDSGVVTVAGDLTVNGTTTTVNSTTVTVDDKNIELGSVGTPTDTTADGGGITLKGATDKTLNWVNSTDSWTSSENVDLASGKTYKINGTDVLSATALGSAVQISSDNIPSGTIVNDDVNASAAIAGTKIDPDFGSQTVETTGVFSAAGGAQGTPSITFTGDLNTGIYSPGADQVAISTGGSGRLFVDASGRVSVGDVSPNFPFCVVGTTTAGIGIRSSSTASRGFELWNNSVSDLAYISNYYNGPIIFQTNNTERVRIDSSGRLLVGTSTQTNSYLLTVEGSATSDTAGGELSLQRGEAATGMSAEDHVGSIYFADNSGNQFAQIRARVDGTPGSSDYPGRLMFSTTADGASSPTERMRIDSSGRVGIGTTATQQTLTIDVNDSSTTQASFNGINIANTNTTANNGSAITFGQTVAGNSNARIGVIQTARAPSESQEMFFGLLGSGSYSERMRIDSSGRVGVGTSSPSSYNADANDLVVASTGNMGLTLASTDSGSSNIYFADGTTGNEAYRGAVAYSHSTDSMGLWTAGGTRMTITSSGNVGVGTTSPDAPLTVVEPGASGAPLFRFIGNSGNGNYIRGSWYQSDNTTQLAQLSVDGTVAMRMGTVASSPLVFTTGNTERLRIDSSGRVGIGTSSPLVDLHVSSSSGNATSRVGGSASGLGLNFDYDQSGSTVSRITANTTYTNTNAKLHICVDGDANPNQLVLDGAGRVGIGTTSPTAPLSVVGGTGADPTIYLVGASNDNARIGSKQNLALACNEDGTESGRTITFNNHTSELARLDSSGRLLVGTSSARNNWNDSGIETKIQIEGAGNDDSAALTIIANSGTTSSDKRTGLLVLGRTRGTTIGSNTAVVQDDAVGMIEFKGSDGTNFTTAATIRAQVDGSIGTDDMPGRLVFSTTQDGQSSPIERLRITNNGIFRFNSGTTGTAAYNYQYNGLSIVGAAFIDTSNSGTTAAVRFFRNTVATQVGEIATSTTGTSYNSSSDYRLKENVVAITDGISRLQQLRPSRFNFIADANTTVDGFLAHEVQDVVPQAITGEKDAVDADGNPIYQGIDQSKLVPLLTAALQEAIGEIEALKARVAALEAN